MGKQGSGSFGSFMLGLVIGAGIGATWALLKAPRSGEETQRQLQRAAEELRQEADNVVSTAKAHVQQAQKGLAEHAEQIRAETEAAVKETKEVLNRGAQDVEEEVRSGAAEVQSTI
jgi:gas vesicle protein